MASEAFRRCFDGKLADCCAGRGVQEAALRAAGIGVPLP